MQSLDKTCIKTFVLLDIETTNVPEYNYNKANITEISFLAVSKNDVLHSDKCEIPRVSQKLGLLFNPRMMVDPESERLSGLSNYNLENEGPFDEDAAKLILLWLKRLQQPVCLVAYNGNSFDFPVIKTSFQKLSMELPSDVLCVDSYKAIVELDSVSSHEEEVEASENETQSTSHILKDEDKINWQQVNETTPRRPTRAIEKLAKRKGGNLDGATCKARKSLFGSDSDPSPTQTSTQQRKPYGYYKLTSVYKRIFGEDMSNAHRAEVDVESMARVILKYGEKFVEYAETNAIAFSEIRALGDPKK